MPRASVAHRQRRKSEIQLERHWKDGLNGGNPITEAIVTFIAGTLHRLEGHCPNVAGPSLVLAHPDYATGGAFSVSSICGSIFSIGCGEICRTSKPGASG